MTENTQLALFGIIVSSNMVFFIYWTYKILIEIKSILIKKLGKIYLFLFLCGDLEKYKIRLKEAHLREDFEILREKI